MKELITLMTRPEGLSDKDYISLLWAELAVILLIVLSSTADGIAMALLIINAVCAVAYVIKFVDFSKVEE